MKKFLRFGIALFVMTGLMAMYSVAQNIVTGGISGTVTDPTGAVVSGAKITLTSKTTGEKRSTTTGSSGLYNFPLLKPGPYTVSVTQTGFRSVTTDIDVQLAQLSTVNLKLEVGNASESVEVTAQTPLLQTEDANISTTIGTAQVENLPNPGGDITTYAQTAPGVVMNSGAGFGFGNFSAFGLPGTSNLFTLNGNDENDPFLNLNNSGSSNLLLGQNELQEVAVVSNGYTGQYGRQAGVQIDYTTKSGGNAFHGDAMYDFNSSGFNANDWFVKGNQLAQGEPNKPVFAVAHQWAASVGGPIVKNKLFFYVDQEGLRYALPGSQTVYFPTPAFVTSLLNNISTNQPAQLPYYTKLMNLYQSASVYNAMRPVTAGLDPSLGCGDIVAAGFGAGAAPCLQTASAAGVNHNKEWLLTTRVDYNISDNDRLFGRFKVDHGSQPTSTDLVNPKVFSTQSIQPEYEGQINETHVFSPRMTNNLIISGLWYSAVFLPDSGQNAVLNALGMSTIAFGAPFAGNLMSNLGGTSPNAPDVVFPQGRNSTMGQVTDDLSISRGSHTLKVGINYRRDELSDFDEQSFTGGVAIFNSMNDFYNGAVNINNGDLYIQQFTKNGEVPLAFYSMGLYVQDEYRVTPNLKFTLALRGDRNSNPICKTNCYSRFTAPFQNLSHDATIPYDAQILTNQHSAFPDVEKVALQPRFGMTWSPFGHSSTVLRGGVGLFSDLYQGVLLDNFIGNSPLTNTFAVTPTTNAPLAPGVAGGVVGTAAASNTAFLNGFATGGTLASISASMPAGVVFSPPNFFSTANKIINPKYMEWNFEIQQAIGTKTSVTLNYVGTHGYDQLVQNAGLNAFGALGQLPAAAPDTRFGAVIDLASVGRSNYDGLIAGINRRATYGLQFSANYTYGHSLDDLTSTNPGTPYNVFTSVTRQINPYSLDANNYSNSDSDARHNLTANYVWDPPYRFQSHLLNTLIGGFGIGETFYYHTAFPYTVTTSQGGISNTNNDIPFLADFLGGPVPSCDSPGNVNNPKQCLQLSQFANPTADFGNVRRNAFRGPKYFNTDLTVRKNFAFTERVRLQLAANMYNVLNHPNFFAPNSNIAGGGFGTIFTTAVPPTTPYGSYQGAGVSGRLIQLQGKISF